MLLEVFFICKNFVQYARRILVRIYKTEYAELCYPPKRQKVIDILVMMHYIKIKIWIQNQISNIRYQR